MKKLILAIVVVASIAGVARAGPVDDFIGRISAAITQLSANDISLYERITSIRAGDISINPDRIDGVTADKVGGAIVQTSHRITELTLLVAGLRTELEQLRSDVSRHVTDDTIH